MWRRAAVYSVRVLSRPQPQAGTARHNGAATPVQSASPRPLRLFSTGVQAPAAQVTTGGSTRCSRRCCGGCCTPGTGDTPGNWDMDGRRQGPRQRRGGSAAWRDLGRAAAADSQTASCVCLSVRLRLPPALGPGHSAARTQRRRDCS